MAPTATIRTALLLDAEVGVPPELSAAHIIDFTHRTEAVPSVGSETDADAANKVSQTE